MIIVVEMIAVARTTRSTAYHKAKRWCNKIVYHYLISAIYTNEWQSRFRRFFRILVRSVHVECNNKFVKRLSDMHTFKTVLYSSSYKMWANKFHDDGVEFFYDLDEILKRETTHKMNQI